jgi:hypothetical protein
MNYKNGQLFWGFLLLTIGVLFLLDRNDIYFYIPDGIISYWPLLIILWGIAILVKNTILKPIVSIASGIFVGMFIFGTVFGFHFNTDSNNFEEQEVSTSTFFEEYRDSTEYATLSLRTGASKIIVEGKTDQLISGTSSGIYNVFNFKTRYRDNTARVVLRHTKDDMTLFGDNNYRNLNFSLNSKPIWDIDLKIGAANIKMDMSDYKIASFDIETGATNSDLKFGDKLENVKVKIEMGAAKMTLQIPKESGCQIKGDMVMVAKDLEGFTEFDEKNYRTDNFESAKNKIEIKFDGGVSSLKVLKY